LHNYNNTERSLVGQLISVCQSVEACFQALQNPAPTFESVASQLRTAVNIWKRCQTEKLRTYNNSNEFDGELGHKKTPIIQTNITAETTDSAATIAANLKAVIAIAIAAEDTIKMAKPMTKGALFVVKQAAGPPNIPPKSAKTPINASDRTFRFITI
jgi:hypothetical protein